MKRLIIEGVDTLEHPGVVYRGAGHDRRAAVAGGPDVWEVVARLRELEGSEEERIAILAAETELHPRALRSALEFAARHPEEIQQRIVRNERAIPRAAATMLHDEFDHDALHVSDLGLSGADDVTVATFARSEHRAVVTENISDYAREPDLVLVCVIKRKLPAGGAQARALAELLDRWATDNPDPYVGQHWPS